MLELRTVGRRVEVIGNSYPVKDKLKALGAKWDRTGRRWYFGKQTYAKNRDAINRLMGQDLGPELATPKQVAFLERLVRILKLPMKQFDKYTKDHASNLIEEYKEKLEERRSREWEQEPATHQPPAAPQPPAPTTGPKDELIQSILNLQTLYPSGVHNHSIATLRSTNLDALRVLEEYMEDGLF